MEGPSQSSRGETKVTDIVDMVDKDGWTPLMIACARNQIKMVKSLLDRGANPNFRSTKDKNTPMHCASSGYLCKEIRFGHTDHFHSRDDRRARIDILRLLVQHGATLTNNSNGLSPLTLAALYNRSDTLDFFLQNDVSHQLQISNIDKAKAYELLGVAYSLNMMIGSEPDKVPRRLFRRALSIYKEEGITSFSDHKPSEIASSFSLFSGKECKSEEDFDETICSHTWSVKNQGFLVAERVLPEAMKTWYLFPRLIKHGLDGVFNNGSNAFCLSQGTRILREVMQWEVESKSHLNSVLVGLLDGIASLEHPVDDDVMKVCYELLDLCLQMLNKLSPDHLQRMSFSLVNELGRFLFDLALYNFVKSNERFESLLQFCERIVRDMRRINNRCESVVHEILGHIVKELWKFFQDAETFDVRMGENRLKHVISRILMCEDATQNGLEGDSMLHSLLGVSGSYMYEMQFTREIALILIRNGCDIEALGSYGETVKDLICNYIIVDGIPPEIEDLITLISPPTSILPLEELAARTILRNKIPYEGVLPKFLSDFVRGNLKLY